MLHHVEIYVSNLTKSIEFWEWLLTELGYEEYQKWDSGISWKHQETYLVFVQAEERFLDIPYHRSRVGLNHLAFHAKSKEQVDEFTKRLKGKGVKILYSDKHPYAGGTDYYAVFFEDPDRIKVELVAPSSP
ncbi:catechol 2,3-dioxygenase-like lactoylglutathione lyase family enzyme [Neobacillus niacini]|uniref:VOC family protein n=1 Tax=Neobacillus niacini TaxID=86668 RepID=UPI001048917E|nr:VOC family protein [Neobacillus niacini]MDR7076963.1 catechol 2,3-dioxygenase-like lactoylglutathione lyase family enzyme [Neobacillus niacini]